MFRLEPDGRHAGADLGDLGAQVNIVGFLEHLLVCGVVKSEVTYLAPYSERQLNGPQTEHGFGAAAPDQLDVLVTNVVDEFLTQLTREAGKDP